MDSKVDDLEALANPLVTAEQLSTTSSRLDGISADLESSLRYAGAQLTQAAGILLRLPQEIIVQAIVTFYRYYVGAEGGSFRVNPLKVFLCEQGIPCAEECSSHRTLRIGYLSSFNLSDSQVVFPACLPALGPQCLRVPNVAFIHPPCDRSGWHQS